MKLEQMFSNLNLHQLLSEPTHFFRDDCAPSCIDLMVTDQPNIVLNCGVRPSLDNTVKHQITFCKINFKIPPPPKFQRKIWHFKRARADLIIKAVSEFPWAAHLQHVHDPNQQVKFLNDFLLNVMSNFVPNEEKIFRPQVHDWLSNDVKRLLRKQNKIYKKYKCNGFKIEDKASFDDIVNKCTVAIKNAKEKFLTDQGAKLANPTTGPKLYWKIMNRFLNKCKIPRIPPLLDIGIYVTDCKQKASIFNKYFALQCTPFLTNSVLPVLRHHTNNRLSSFNVTAAEITEILIGLKVNKAHGPDEISGNMIKLCGHHISIPLKMIFDNIIRTGIFPDQWKEANVTPVHKKKDKQLVANYRPISLLPILAKVFERIVFKNLYNHLLSNNLITKNQSGFRPGDSGTNQLLSLVDDIHKAFDDKNCLEVRSIYLDVQSF